MKEEELISAIDILNKFFYSVYPEDDHSIDELLNRFSYLVRKKNCRAIVIDPYNQVQHLIKSGEREDLYISRFMAKLKRFAVKHDIAVHLVAHQTTPQVISGENYPKPNIYKIKGGGTFSDKADNVIAVWREHRNTDQSNTEVKFISQKIKKQKLTGIPGEAIIEYNRRTNRYYYFKNSPLDDSSFETFSNIGRVVGEQEQIQFNPNKGIEPNEYLEIDEIPF